MHGQWTMDLNERASTADFSAVMTMSGYGKTAAGTADPTQGGASPHEHHVNLTNMKVTWNTDGCPAWSPAPLRGL